MNEDTGVPRAAPHRARGGWLRRIEGPAGAHPSLARTGHRPWPLPEAPWAWRQSWHDLLFAHWPVPAASLRPLIPPELALEEWEGSAWIGVVPFTMTGVTPRPLPDLPGVSAFPELNVRTYVERGGRAGVWFFSLDAGSRLAVWAARALFGLPYHHARFRVVASAGRVDYASTRSGAPPVRFHAAYRPTGAPYRSRAGTLEHWLTERYCLYARGRGGGIARTEVHHPPWPLQPAEADIAVNGMLAPLGLALPSGPPLLHFSRRMDVVVWSPVAG